VCVYVCVFVWYVSLFLALAEILSLVCAEILKLPTSSSFSFSSSDSSSSSISSGCSSSPSSLSSPLMCCLVLFFFLSLVLFVFFSLASVLFLFVFVVCFNYLNEGVGFEIVNDVFDGDGSNGCGWRSGWWSWRVLKRKCWKCDKPLQPPEQHLDRFRPPITSSQTIIPNKWNQKMFSGKFRVEISQRFSESALILARYVKILLDSHR